MWSHCTLKTMTKKDRQISEKSEFMRYKTIESKFHANEMRENIDLISVELDYPEFS